MNISNAAKQKPENASVRRPVHVVYGGADRFVSETPQKLGKLALDSLEIYAPNFAEFARSFGLAEKIPQNKNAVVKLETRLQTEAESVKNENFAAWLAWNVYNRTIEKLRHEPVEDFRIDFEDGYGFRTDAEEDAHALSASAALAESFLGKTITPFCGFRIKSFQPETYTRAVRTQDIFLTNLLNKTKGRLPENFAVTLPKITHAGEVAKLARLLDKFERKNNLVEQSVAIEIMIETPQAIFNERGEANLRKLVEAGKGRVKSAHFGAYDYTASLGISGVYQDLRHESCNFARQMMQVTLAPLNIRLSDSVTTEMPVAVYKSGNLTEAQHDENIRAVCSAWRKHFENVTFSLSNGFYQSWDLHPAQLVARYAALYAFFLQNADLQAKRLKGFIEKATRANLTGNTFDDAASAQGLLNFFLSALNSGAMREDEIAEKTQLTVKEIQTASFIEILENRRRNLPDG